MKKLLILLLFSLINCKQKDFKNYTFETIKVSDSASNIKWTNGKIVQLSSEPINDFYLDEKTHIKWANNKFICLRHSNGSDTWTDIILPLDNNNFKIIENALAYDRLNGIVVCETDSANYKLFAENINSGKRLYIGSYWENCSSIFPHYCIDSISIKDKKLYVEWTLPNNIEKSAKKQIKKIRLNL
ncbi:hypothetical protein [Epilithonimonas hominis]|nr:hypothetical protein [Epilithonimonas hominis]